MILILALAAATVLTDIDQRTAHMSSIYEKICLQAFPDDKAVAELMKAQNARELTTDEVKITMRDDPARAWALSEEQATVWIEFPPFHACSMRWNATSIGNLDSYRLIADKYEDTHPGFRPVDPYNADIGGIHVHAIGEQRKLSDKRTESLYVFDQKIADPRRRAAGDNGVVVRFVHQFAPPAPGGSN